MSFGLCLADFLSAPDLPSGRFACPPVADEWAAAERAGFVRDGPLAGPRWTLLGDSVVLVAPVDGGSGRLRLLYRSTGFAGGVFDAAVEDGALRALLPNRATVIVKPEGEGALTWTSSDGARSISGRLSRGRQEP
jgi:hypothetical protein